jgi:hypothetical protein
MLKFGAAGDFVTAPEISDLFGHCLARQAEALLAQGCAPGLLEFGAGSGPLAFGAAGEYFFRKAYFWPAGNSTDQSPQFRVFAAWRQR